MIIDTEAKKMETSKQIYGKNKVSESTQCLTMHGVESVTQTTVEYDEFEIIKIHIKSKHGVTTIEMFLKSEE